MGIASIAGAITNPSLLASIFGFEPSLIGPAGQELVIDVVEAEAATFGFGITSDPVESGSEIADHIQDNPPSLILDCVFVDMMWGLLNIASGLINGNLSLRTWADKRDALYRMKDAKQLVNVSAPLGFYQNYLIESVDAFRDTGSGNCFRCRISLRKVNIVASTTGYIDPALLPVDLGSSVSTANKNAGGKNPANKGTQSPTDGSTPTDSAASSTHRSTADAYGYIKPNG